MLLRNKRAAAVKQGESRSSSSSGSTSSRVEYVSRLSPLPWVWPRQQPRLFRSPPLLLRCSPNPSLSPLQMSACCKRLVLLSLRRALLQKTELPERRIRVSLPSFRLFRCPCKSGQLCSVRSWQQCPLSVVHFVTKGFVLSWYRMFHRG